MRTLNPNTLERVENYITEYQKKNEEKINARGMVKQLAVGIIVMFVLAMGTPLVINGLSHWVTW